MRIMALAATAALLLAAPAATQAPARPQAALDTLAARVGYRYAVVDNHPDCPPAAPGCFLATITLTLPDPLPASLPMDGLSLWFSFANPLLEFAKRANLEARNSQLSAQETLLQLIGGVSKADCQTILGWKHWVASAPCTSV